MVIYWDIIYSCSVILEQMILPLFADIPGDFYFLLTELIHQELLYPRFLSKGRDVLTAGAYSSTAALTQECGHGHLFAYNSDYILETGPVWEGFNPD